jgi:hypothetical protein
MTERRCSWQECTSVLRPNNKTGVCYRHLNVWTAVDFDHLDPATKTHQVSYMLQMSLARIFEEVLKTEVRCSNCHRIRSAGRWHADRAAAVDSPP